MSKEDSPTPASVPVVEREAFEKWARPITATAMENGRYVEVMTSLAWEAWQARTALSSSPAPVQTEVRADGETVRVDRWQVGIRRIVALLWGNRHEFEVDEVVEAVRALIPSPKDDEDSLVQAVLDRPAPVQGEQDKEHAENYRWLRDTSNIDFGPRVTEQRCNDWGKWFTVQIRGEELDAAIRAARSTGGQS